MASDTLRGKYFSNRKRISLNLGLTSLVALVLIVITDGFIQGLPAQLEEELFPEDYRQAQASWLPALMYAHRRWVPEMLYMLPFHIKIVVNLDELEVSTKLPPGSGAEGKEGPPARGASLKGKDLRYASAKGACLARADLRRARLDGAYLRSADLREAKLGEAGVDADGARLSRAFLFKADLRKACLYHATLAKAAMVAANLDETDLERADLTEANLAYASLQKARFNRTVLKGANLQEANLKGVRDLEIGQLKQAKCWVLAVYERSLLEKLGLPETPEYYESQFRNKNLSLPTPRDFTGQNLQEADFSSYDLQFVNFARTDLRGARLVNSKLAGAILTEAVLKDATLQGAELWGAQGLTPGQLHQANAWVLAFYNPAQLQMLGLPGDHNDRLRARDLRGYPLGGANLKEVDLEGFNLEGARLENADLRGADLRGVKNLTRKQLSSAKCDKNTKLPEYLESTRR